jgi:elongation factor Ts
MQGKVFSYIHFNGQVGSLVKISSITDFAAKTEEFMNFGKNVAMQIAMTDPQTLNELLLQKFIKDESIDIEQLRGRAIDALKEDIRREGFQRFSFK